MRWVWVVLVAGCVETLTVPCGDQVCPSDRVCVPASNGCFEPEEVEGCLGAQDGDDCQVRGVDGRCDRGVCATSICGDGELAGPEICDDGNTLDGDSCDPTCLVASCLVPTTHPDIPAAIADDSCPVVYVTPGQYLENLTIDRDVEIVTAGQPAATIDGTESGTVIVVPVGVAVTLTDLRIVNGSSSECGGGIVNSGDLLLERVEVDGNRSLSSGGGICHQAGSLLMIGATISNNEVNATAEGNASARGGGIFASSDVLGLGGTRLLDNRVTASAALPSARGGGIFVDNSTATFSTGCEISGNQIAAVATTTGGFASGGGISAQSSTLTVNRCVLDGNTVTSGASSIAGGGAIESSGSATIATATFTNNRVEAESGFASGGALQLLGSTGAIGSITSATFDDNAAVVGSGGAFGGAIDLAISTGQSMTFLLVRARGNTADGGTDAAHGSAISVIGSGSGSGVSIRLVDSELAGNTSLGSTDSSGALEVQTTTIPTRLEVVNSTIAENQTPGDGGGIRLDSPGPETGALELENSTLANNSARDGGGLAATASGAGEVSVIISNATIARNTATGSSGGIAVASGSFAVLQNSIVASNTAAIDSDCSAPGIVLLGGHNLFVDPGTCSFAAGVINTTATPLLGVLASNGGPTRTLGLDAGSPAIDGGDPVSGCRSAIGQTLLTDQRGLPRPQVGCDIGAFEVQP